MRGTGAVIGRVAPQSKIHRDILLRRVSPSSLLLHHTTVRSFQTGSERLVKQNSNEDG